MGACAKRQQIVNLGILEHLSFLSDLDIREDTSSSSSLNSPGFQFSMSIFMFDRVIVIIFYFQFPLCFEYTLDFDLVVIIIIDLTVSSFLSIPVICNLHFFSFDTCDL